jgi:hypothetical protein
MIELLKTIWSNYESSYPASGPVRGWLGFRFKVKCSVCVLLGLRGDGYGGYESVPVYVGPWHSYETFDGPGASWPEIAGSIGWRRWEYYEYSNGI